MNAHMHKHMFTYSVACIRIHTRACTDTHARTHARTHRLVCQGDGTEEKVFKQRMVFKADLKELTQAER